MFRGDEINVVTALFLQSEHHAGQFLGFDRPAFTLTTDFVVLAENAAQVAPTEEDGTRALRTTETALLVSRTSSVRTTTLSVPALPPAILLRRPATSTPSLQPTEKGRRWRFRPSTGTNTRVPVFALGCSAPIQLPANSRPCCATPLPRPARRSFSGTTIGTRLMLDSGPILSGPSIDNARVNVRGRWHRRNRFVCRYSRQSTRNSELSAPGSRHQGSPAFQLRRLR